MLVLVLMCKNNGFCGKRRGNDYNWKEEFESYGEECRNKKNGESYR